VAKKRLSPKSPTLEKMLAQSSKEELIEIIKAVVKRDPTMKELVDLAMAAPNPTLRALRDELQKARL
jgi:tRNA A37 threonylcarbamoyladenosine dehydratase